MRCARLLHQGAYIVFSSMLTLVVEQEVHPEILESMVEFLSTSSTSAEGGGPGIARRTYYWGDLAEPPVRWNQITTREEGKMISGGSLDPVLSLQAWNDDLVSCVQGQQA